ncbi:rCG63261 [Rattus norvegicus]|uniref:RCG63261 n=1 Tax=Rattus norvegicus TaxID=10116 RepID=A6JFZ9_RAT|nr:rCG63261 [Rattus norvegicus]
MRSVTVCNSSTLSSLRQESHQFKAENVVVDKSTRNPGFNSQPHKNKQTKTGFTDSHLESQHPQSTGGLL